METQTKEVEEPESNSSTAKPESTLGKNLKILGLLGFIFVKAKGLLIPLLKLKGVATFITMMINIAAYWWTGKLGLPGAIGFVGLIFVHEMGHVMALRYYKVPATSPIFIPFVGAFVGMKTMPKNAFEEAVVALAGPVIGSLGALACLPMYLSTGNKLWLWLFATGILINLFNLIPATPLDGGRIIGAVWRGFWIVGVLILFGAAIATKDFYLVLIGTICLAEMTENCAWSQRTAQWTWLAIVATVLGLVVAWQHWWGLFAALLPLVHLSSVTNHWDVIVRNRKDQNSEYHAVSLPLRLGMGTAYVVLTAVLAAGLYWVNTLNAFSAVPK